jgi:hypothetical protein
MQTSRTERASVGVWNQLRAERIGKTDPGLGVWNATSTITNEKFEWRLGVACADRSRLECANDTEDLPLVLRRMSGASTGKTPPYINNFAKANLRILFGIDGGLPSGDRKRSKITRYISASRRAGA